MRPTWAEINLDNLAHNFKAMRRHVASGVATMCVVKSDAYGHGAVECAKRLAAEGAEWFGVALPEEAAALRSEAQIAAPILALGGFWRGQEALLLKERITPVVYTVEMAESFDRAAQERNEIADVHVKIDTGMGRLGVRFDAINDYAERLKACKHLRVDGLMTHFAAADDAAENDFTDEQIRRFEAAREIFLAKGFRPVWFDLANSPAALAHEKSWKNLVRVGGALYGIGKDIFPASKTVEDLKPVMRLRSEITLLKKVPAGETLGYARSFTTARDSLIATVPIGYNDGVPRALSNKGAVVVKNVKAPIVGRISMDLIVVDATDAPDVAVADEVEIIGAAMTVEEIAALADTISYEITCGISNRVPRVFISE
jgi:alanine racemase